MKDGGQRNTGTVIADWESELWSYLSQSDGIKCPIFQFCTYRIQGGWCLSEHPQCYGAITAFVDSDKPDINDLEKLNCHVHSCPNNGRLFQLIQKLAYKYHEQAAIYSPPVPSDLITKGEDNLPIEVRYIPLHSHHGAVWQLSDCWLIQLNSNDNEPRQRFTLYHEIFHIMVHCRACPVFKNMPYFNGGIFNELLADHFASIMLMPKNMILRTWGEVRDVDRVADIFVVPRSLVLIAVQNWNLT